MDHQPEKSAVELGLLSPPPAPPPPPSPPPQRECEEESPLDKEALSEEEEGEKAGVHESGKLKLCVRGHWRPSEDAKLKELVAQHGPQNWNMIAEKLDGRSGKSCRLRWFNQLDPKINRRAFSVEEEEKLLAVHRVYGNKWALIARLFPGRTDNAVKNQWHVIMARKQREQCSNYRRRRAAGAAARVASAPLTRALSSHPQAARSGGESTVTSNRDESASTCTGLPLNPSSSARVMPYYLKDVCASQLQQAPLQLFFGYYEKCGESGSGLSGNAQAHQLGCSDATSEGSATESAADHLEQADKDGGDRKRIRVPFIDFLGVGAI